MKIWTVTPSREALGFDIRPNMIDTLGITIDEVGDDYLTGSMPVDHRTRQSMGILHGGASVTLAETLGSLAANFCVDLTRYVAVGMQINSNHLRPATTGRVVGTARPVHLGRRTQVWRIDIENDRNQLIATSTLSMAVVERDRILQQSGPDIN